MGYRLRAALIVVVLAASCDDAPPSQDVGQAPRPSPTAEHTPEEADPQSRKYVGFRPTSSVEDGKVVMPLAFVDGSKATVVASPKLGLQETTAAVYTSGGLGGIDRTIDFRYRDGSAFMHKGPLETYEGVDGSEVELWDPVPDMPAGCPNLMFRFGDWFVGVRTCQDHLSDSEKRTWARSLRGEVTDEGFLVLSAEPPLVLQEAGGHEGPELILGMDRSNWVQFEPGKCDSEKIPDEGDIRTMTDGTKVSFSQLGGGNNSYKYDWGVTWCEDGLVTVQVDYAYKRFAEAVAEGLRLRDIVLAH